MHTWFWKQVNNDYSHYDKRYSQHGGEIQALFKNKITYQRNKYNSKRLPYCIGNA